MQIAYLPRVFSHLLMIVLGMALYNVFSPAPPKQTTVKFRSGYVYVALVRGALISEGATLGQEVDFLIKRQDLRCRLNLRGARLHSVQPRSLLVSMPKKHASVVLEYLQRGEVQAVYQVGADDTQVRAICGRKTLVVYGVH
ncbi:MAG: hypothetical protein OYH77_02455 [Pseudomonadota bacterium]|nr:hypothetical protein [Pseudomonadota bacterium]